MEKHEQLRLGGSATYINMTCGSQIRPGAEELGWYWYTDTHLYPLQLTFLFKGHHLWAPSCDFSLHIFMTHENDHFTAHLKCILMPNTLALSTWSDDLHFYPDMHLML